MPEEKQAKSIDKATLEMLDKAAEEKIATAEELQRVACPVGVKIRSKTVPEIAVSIMAQFIDKRAELVYEARNEGPQS